MDNFAVRLQATAMRLLAYFGNPITVTRNSVSNYNTTTGEATTGPTFTYTGYGNQSQFNLLERLNTNILQTDIKFLFASDTRPEVGDLFVVEGNTLRVENVSIDNAQDTDILYTLQLRIG